MNYDLTSLINELGSLTGGLLVFIFVLAGIFLLLLIFYLIVNILFFIKCNKPGWAAIIPYYSSWVECEIAGTHWLIFVFAILGSAISFLGIKNNAVNEIADLLSFFAYIAFNVNVAKKFHKDTGFTVGLILLPFIFLPILTFSKDAVYDKNVKVKNGGFFDINF